MIKSNQQLLNRIHVILDAIVIIVSYLLAYYIRIGSPIFPEVAQGLSFGYYILALAVLTPFYLVLFFVVVHNGFRFFSFRNGSSGFWGAVNNNRVGK